MVSPMGVLLSGCAIFYRIMCSLLNYLLNLSSFLTNNTEQFDSRQGYVSSINNSICIDVINLTRFLHLQRLYRISPVTDVDCVKISNSVHRLLLRSVRMTVVAEPSQHCRCTRAPQIWLAQPVSRLTFVSKLSSRNFLVLLSLKKFPTWRWRHHISPKHFYRPTSLHGVMTYNATVKTFIILKAWNLMIINVMTRTQKMRNTLWRGFLLLQIAKEYLGGYQTPVCNV
jgi:hypothetical protein